MTFRPRSISFLMLVLVGSAAVTVACGKDGGGDEHSESEPQVCKDISGVCHDLDMGEGMGHDCHEQAHAGDAAVCEMIHDECIAFCTGGASTGTDTGSTSTPMPTTGETDATTHADEDTTHGHDTTAGHDDTTAGHDDTTAAHDSGTETGGSVCDLLGTGCHDVKTPEGQACHDLGHDGDVAACEEALAECTKICGL